MARHRVGEYQIEVLHRARGQGERVNVAVYVFLKGECVEQADFAFNGFNSLEMRRRLPALSGFYVQKLGEVIDDAREWPKIGNGKPKPNTRPKAKKAKKSKAGKTKRPEPRKAKVRRRPRP